MNFYNNQGYPKPPVPRCRPPISKIAEHNNNSYNMSLSYDSSTMKHKIKRNNSKEADYLSNVSNNISSNSDFDCDCTDSESSTDDASKTNFLNELKEDDSSVRKTSGNVKDGNSTHPFLCISIMVSLIILVISLIYNSYFHVSQKHSNDPLVYNLRESNRVDIEDLRQSVGNIQYKFTNQKYSMWNTFLSQVEEVINESTQISMIILLGNETNTVTCLAHLLGSVSTKALGSDSYLTLNARNMGSDHGKIINKLKAEIWINRVVVIEDLLTMNSEAIKVFHSLCDKENPLISKVVYIITIVSSGYEGSHEDKFVEDRLTAKFSKAIDVDILNPLITRIMDGPIITILPEPSMKGKNTIEECLLF